MEIKLFNHYHWKYLIMKILFFYYQVLSSDRKSVDFYTNGIKLY